MDFHFHDDRSDTDSVKLITLPGLTRFLHTPLTPRPKVLPADHPMTKQQRAAYNAARILYMSGGILFKTKEHQWAHTELRNIFAKNIHPYGGSSSMLISGEGTLGKTTLLTALMRDLYDSYIQRFPHYEDDGYAPIVFIEVPPGSNAKRLLTAFANFFGMAVGNAETADSIRHRVIAALNTARTQLVVVDELHNLSALNIGNGESIDVLRNLHNQTRASYVYAGLNLESANIFKGPQGVQLRGRSSLMQMTRFNLANPAHAADWNGLVSAFEKAVPLAEHPVGTLKPLSTYLWERTNGSIGSLGDLITSAARTIINDIGVAETITKEILDAQTIDAEAEASFSGRKRNRK